MIILEGHKIEKTYFKGKRALEILKAVGLRVSKGQFLSIVGPSGAGKSTLLHILGGLDKPTKGKVLFEDKDIYKINDSQRAGIRNSKFGFVFQFYHLLGEFTALENVCMPAYIMKKSKKIAQKKALEIFSLLGLRNRVGHFPSQLSGGEMQRVAIARALINKPEILFCDEPTGNLDSGSGKQIKDLLIKINKENGQTIVLVTHDEKLSEEADMQYRIRDGLIEEKNKN